VCGVACVVGPQGAESLRRVAQRLIDCIPHRGPDGEGVYAVDSVALGHRRLAIIDLSSDGAQPMYSGDGKLVLSFNGEIYNYIELRAELRSLGVKFRTQTDSEVILASYATWGPSCVTRFNGMWAFMIHDKERGVVFGSRDRFGVKPLYYTEIGGMMAFASEIRQLLPLLPSICANAALVTDFLLTSFSDHQDETYFDAVRRVPAGHSFELNTATMQLRFSRYYSIGVREDLRTLSPNEAAMEYRRVFEDSVRLRMRSDVRVGTCLSGGLDSSSVAAIAARVYGESTSEQFCAITAVSEQASNDESVYAKQMVDRCGLHWHRVQPSYEEFAATLPAVVRAQEEPYASPSINMQWFVMRTARENGVTVLLDGQGGDETLLGYEKYFASYFYALVRKNGCLAGIRGLYEASRNNSKMSFGNTLKFIAGGMSARARFFVHRSRNRYLRYSGGVPWFLSALASEAANDRGLQKLEIERTNLPILLRYEDKNSMAHSIETRLPFLDYRAVETALSIPILHKIQSGWTKWILRTAMQDVLPGPIAWRRNKMGFEAPESLWLPRHDEVMRQTVFGSALVGALTRLDRLGAAWSALGARAKWRLYSVALWEAEFGLRA